MNPWTKNALELLEKSLSPFPQELNRLDWKLDLSQKENRMHCHLSAFANTEGGGFLAFGIDQNGTVVGIDKLSLERVLTKLANIARDGLEPSITIDHGVESFREETILLVHIAESTIKPVHLRGRPLEDSYVRSGGQTRKMDENDLRKAIMASSPARFEEMLAGRFTSNEVLQRLEYIRLFEMLTIPVPRTADGIIDQLISQRILVPVGDQLEVTNLGVFICAKELQSFAGKERKAVRVVKYDGTSRVKTERELEGKRGYAVGFEGLIQYITSLLPASEIIKDALREEVSIYPQIAVRELVANALIHQDLMIPGMGPMIEIFSDRMEITNPGKLLPSIRLERLIDTAPESRNELLAAFMRRLKICEERGSGIDKALLAIEVFGMPPPEFIEGENYFRVILFSPRPFSKMTKEERTRACYFHCCLKHISADRMTNATLRKRFKVEKGNYPVVSKIITDTIKAGLVKLGDPQSKSRKHAFYIPFWA